MAASSELLQKLQRRRERNGERSPLLDIGSNHEGTRTTDFEAVKVQQRRIVFEAATSDRPDLRSWEQIAFSPRQTQQSLSSSALKEAYMLPKDSADVDLENVIPECYHENISPDAHADKGISELHRKLQRRRKRMGEQFQQRGIDTSLFDSVTKDLEMVKVDERRTMFENAELRITPPNANPGRLDVSKWEQQFEEDVQPMQQACPDRHHVGSIRHEKFTGEMAPKDCNHNHFVRAGNSPQIPISAIDSPTSFTESNDSSDIASELLHKLQCRRKRMGDLSLLGDDKIVSANAAKDFESVNVDERRSIFEGLELQDSNGIVQTETGRLDLRRWEGAELQDSNGTVQIGTGRLDLSKWDNTELQDSNVIVQTGIGRLDSSKWEDTALQDSNGIVQTGAGRLDLSKWEGAELQDSEGTAQNGAGRLDLNKWEGAELRDSNGPVQAGTGRLDSNEWGGSEFRDSNGPVQTGTGKLDLSNWEGTQLQDANGTNQARPGRIDLSKWEGNELQDSTGIERTVTGRLDLTSWESELLDDKPTLQQGPYRQQSACISEEISPRRDASKVAMKDCLAKESSVLRNSIDPCNVGSEIPQDQYQKREQVHADCSGDDAIVFSRDSQTNGFEAADVMDCRSAFTRLDLQGPHISAIPGSLDLSPWEEELIARGVLTYQQACLLRKHAPNSYNTSLSVNQDTSLPPNASNELASKTKNDKSCTQDLERDPSSENLGPACEACATTEDSSESCKGCADLPQVSEHRHNRQGFNAVSRHEGDNVDACDHLLEDHDLQKSHIDGNLGRLNLSQQELTVDRDVLPMRKGSPWRAKDTHALNDSSETVLEEMDSKSGQRELCCATRSPAEDEPLPSNLPNMLHVDSTERLLLQACDILANSDFTSKRDSDSGSPEAAIKLNAEEIEHHECIYEASIEKLLDKTSTDSEVDASTMLEDRKAEKSVCRVIPAMLDMNKIQQRADSEDFGLSQVRYRDYQDYQLASHAQEEPPLREDCKRQVDTPCYDPIAPSAAAILKTSSARQVRQEVQSTSLPASSSDTYSPSTAFAPTLLVPTLAPTKRISAVLAVPVSASSTATCIASNYIVAQGRLDTCASSESFDPSGLAGMSRIHSIGDISLGSRGNPEAFGRIRHWPGRRLGPSTPCTPRSRSCSTTTSPNKQGRQARGSRGAAP